MHKCLNMDKSLMEGLFKQIFSMNVDGVYFVHGKIRFVKVNSQKFCRFRLSGLGLGFRVSG